MNRAASPLRFVAFGAPLASALRERGLRPATGARADVHWGATPPSYAEWRAGRLGWVLHVPGVGDVVDARRRRARLVELARLAPPRDAEAARAACAAGTAAPIVVGLLVTPADPARAFVALPPGPAPRGPLRPAAVLRALRALACALHLASLAEAARAGIDLARTATLLAVSVAPSRDPRHAAIVGVRRVPTLGASTPLDALAPAALEALDVIPRRGPDAPFAPLTLPPGLLVVPRRAELAALRATRPSWSPPRLVASGARLGVVDPRLALVDARTGEAFAASDTAALLWVRLVEDGARFSRVVDELAARFPSVPRAVIEGDALDAIAPFVARGFVATERGSARRGSATMGA